MNLNKFMTMEVHYHKIHHPLDISIANGETLPHS